jgi:hypothetical protein
LTKGLFLCKSPFATSKTPRETDRKAGRKIVMVIANEYVVVYDVRLAMGSTSYRCAGGVQSIDSCTMANVLMVDVSELAPTDCEARAKQITLAARSASATPEPE